MVKDSISEVSEKVKNWQDAARFRARADESANYLRALLFATTIAAIGYVAAAQKDCPSFWHLLSTALFAIALFVLWKSWVIQKAKSLARAESILADGLEEFVKTKIKQTTKQKQQKCVEGTKEFIVKFFSEVLWHKEYSKNPNEKGIQNESVDFTAALFIVAGLFTEGLILFAS